MIEGHEGVRSLPPGVITTPNPAAGLVGGPNIIPDEIVLPEVGVCNLPTPQTVYILYTNWQGATAWRRILPISIHFTSTPSHPVKQWLLQAMDLDKGEPRSFAVKDIQNWRTTPPTPPPTPAA